MMTNDMEVFQLKKDMDTQNKILSFEEYGDVVNVTDIQNMLGIGRTLAYSLLRTKTIYSIRVGRKYIIPKQSVIDFLMSNS